MNKIPTSLYFLLLKNNKKENFKIILEPLQAVLQLSLLSISPIGTKLSIQNNLLYIQPPSWKQSIVRSYYMDNKEELYYLFNVIQRFHHFYNYLNNRNDHLSELIPLITKMVEKGIDRLIQTYQSTETHSLLHTLQMYKMIIINPDVFASTSTNTAISNEKEGSLNPNQNMNNNRSRSNSSQIKRNHYYDEYDSSHNDSDEEDHDEEQNQEQNQEHNINEEKQNDYDSDYESNSDFANSSDEEDEKTPRYHGKHKKRIPKRAHLKEQHLKEQHLKEEKFVKKDPIQINDVFIHIRDLYSEEILQIIYYTLLMIDKSVQQNQETKDAIDYDTYIQGLNMVLQNTNTQIQQWIKKNILIT